MWVEIEWVDLKFTSIQSWLHVFEIREAGLAAVADMLNPNEIWAMIGVPIAAVIAAIMVGLESVKILYHTNYILYDQKILNELLDWNVNEIENERKML